MGMLCLHLAILKKVSGDQWLSTSALTLEIVAGESHLVAEDFELDQVLECQSLLTSLGGDETSINKDSIYLAQVELNSELKQAIRLSPSQKLWFSNQRRDQSVLRYLTKDKLFLAYKKRSLLMEGLVFI